MNELCNNCGEFATFRVFGWVEFGYSTKYFCDNHYLPLMDMDEDDGRFFEYCGLEYIEKVTHAQVGHEKLATWNGATWKELAQAVEVKK